MSRFKLRCTECKGLYPEEEVSLVCPKCSKNQLPGREIRGVLTVEYEERSKEIVQGDLPLNHPKVLASHWPIKNEASLPNLPVGATPLIKANILGEYLGLDNLWIKDDSRNPSGSTKDRASLLVVAKALEYGSRTVVTASTGNAATALAAVSAAASIKSVVIVPASAPVAKLVQMMNYGAKVIPVQGTYDDAFELSIKVAERFNWYNRNTALNPYTIEGKKTLGLEIAAQLLFREKAQPDVVFVPTGDGVILAGVAKGFKDLQMAGILERLPRLFAVQPEGSSIIVRSLHKMQSQKGNKPEKDFKVALLPPKPSNSVADSLNVDMPRNARLCLKEIVDSNGDGVIVVDDAILESIGLLARTTGVFAEPAAAAVLAGLMGAIDGGMVDKKDHIVLCVTGTGLKDIKAASRLQPKPKSIPADIDSLAEIVL